MKEFDFSVIEIRSIGAGFKVFILTRTQVDLLARAVLNPKDRLFIIEYKPAISFKRIFTLTTLNPCPRILR